MRSWAGTFSSGDYSSSEINISGCETFALHLRNMAMCVQIEHKDPHGAVEALTPSMVKSLGGIGILGGRGNPFDIPQDSPG